jgi:hypothetical protein
LVQVVIGELKGQGLRIMSQGLWYDKLDNYADYTFTNVGYGLRKKGFYCTAMVWGCYND